MLHKMLNRLIKVGSLKVIGPDGSSAYFGVPSPTDPSRDVVVRLKGSFTPLKLMLHPDLFLGEAYMDGALVVEHGTLWDLLDICGRNLARMQSARNWLAGLAKVIIRHIHQRNSVDSARRHVAHHYDLSDALYCQFLGADLQYSCGYFRTPTLTLDDAQDAKKQHIAAKLLLRPGQRVLDVGCGWGGLALSLATTSEIEVVGVTLSREQLAIARQRARKAGLEDRVKFELLDYRQLNGKFDRIVSVGMFEHVGTPYYRQFFDTVVRLLTDDGVALIHSIGRMHGPDLTSAWIRKYIFPGGYIPALSQVMPAIEKSGLWVTDIEILRLHYAETLRHWRERFMKNRSIMSEIYDERFCRMWEFYLAISEMSFRYSGFLVFQAQLARRADTVPLTRDYMLEHELPCRSVIAAE